jgi:hypothetical protein
VRRDRARLRQHLPTLHLFTLGPAQQHPDVVPGLPLVQQLRNISTPVHTVASVGFSPTISSASPTFTIPRSTRPVTTVPRPEIENTSSTGIRNGPSIARCGCGM